MLSISLPTMFLIIIASVICSEAASMEQIVAPSRKTVMVSAIAKISFNLWEIMIQVTPCSFNSLISFNRFWLSSSFNEAVGSSKINSLTFLLNAFAISTNCWLPTPSSFTFMEGSMCNRTFSKTSLDFTIVSFQSMDFPFIISCPK